MTLINGSRSRRPARMMAAYVLMIAAALASFLVVRWYGETLATSAAVGASESSHVESTSTTASGSLFHLLLALAAVIVVGRILGALFAYLRQPPVIGEVLAGICLGPSLLGRIAPGAGEFLLPPSVAPSLSVVAQLGVILYMFIVGLELNASMLRKQGHLVLVVSHASIVLPFALGAVLALWLYPMLASRNVSFTAFALFISVSLSITAFPVLARILSDRRWTKTDLGVIALGCAAINDIAAWCLLALVVGVTRSQIGAGAWIAALSVAYIALMFVVVRPVVARFVPRTPGDEAPGIAAMMLVGLLVSALLTEAIGVHAIFGAFLFGVVVPHDSPLARELAGKLEGLVTTLLLPAFFAFTGMRTQVALVSGSEQWLACGATIALATIGKFGGATAAARAMGLAWRDAASLGALMNTRGLMELIVLNVGLDLGVISPTLFAMMVLMAIVTTMATSPILHYLGSETSPLVSPARVS